MIIIKTTNDDDFHEIITKQELEKYMMYINMIYKWKDKTILPVNIFLSNDINLGDEINHDENPESLK